MNYHPRGHNGGPPLDDVTVKLPTLHAGQAAAWWKFKLSGKRRFLLRCGRRFGKTDMGKTWLADAAIRGFNCAWYAPEHKTWSEAYSQLADHLAPIMDRGSSKNNGVMRLTTGGRIDWWTLGSGISGRGRDYARVVMDEAAFSKNGKLEDENSGMSMWDKVIEPTLYDRSGEVLVMSNSAGKVSDNFLYQISPDPTGGDPGGTKHGFVEYYATMADNPVLPHRLAGESYADWQLRRLEILAERKRTRDPLVYAQEDLAEFVDWSGVAFFTAEKWLVNGLPVNFPPHCDSVIAIIDTAMKTGYEHDGTAVLYAAVHKLGMKWKVTILDWDIQKIEGNSLSKWLPGVYAMLDQLAKDCGARSGSLGAFIEDKGSGTVLLQHARNKGWKAHAIDGRLTGMGKDERAFSASPYFYMGDIKISATAFNKITTYNKRTLNHLTEQVYSFRMADKDAAKREDDLIDCLCYLILVTLGNSEMFG